MNKNSCSVYENEFEEFSLWLSKAYPNMCPYFVLLEDIENDIIMDEYFKDKFTNKIINGDSKYLLKQINDNSVDLFLSDPPYKVTKRGSHGGTGGMLKKKINKDGKVFKHNTIDISEWIDDVYRILKDGSHCYIMTNNKNLHHYLNEIVRSGLKIYKVLIWDKKNVITNMFYMDSHEYIIFCRKGKAKKINNCGTKSILSIPNIKTKINGENIHDTEKPLDLMRILIKNSSKDGDLVIDPFCGGGSVPVVCKEENRRFYAFDLDSNYCNTTRSRIEMVDIREKGCGKPLPIEYGEGNYCGHEFYCEECSNILNREVKEVKAE